MSASWDEPAVVVVSGIQAAGKTMVGRMLATRLPRAAFVDGDVLARTVVASHEPMSRRPSGEAERQLRLRYRQAALLAGSFWDDGFTAVVADNIYGEAELLWFLEKAVAEFQGYLAMTPRLGLWIDSTDQTPEGTVDTILSRAWTEGRVR